MLSILPLMIFSLQATPPQQTRQFMEVTPDGAFLRKETSSSTVNRLDSPATVTSARWQNLDSGAYWIGGAVDVGDNGGAIMTGRYLNSEGVALYGSHSPDELFFVDTLNSEAPYVAIADRAPVAASMVVVDTDPSANYDFEGTLSVFDTTGTGTADWTYTFPLTQNYFGGGVAVSDDAKIVLAWKADPNSGNLLIEAFDRYGNSISSGTLNDGAGNFHARQARLCDDGRRAYIFIGATAYIWDVFAAAPIHSHYIGASFDSHAFSGDGFSFAYGSFGFLNVYRESAGAWNLEHSESFSGGTYVAQLDLNQNGKRLAYEVQRYSPAYDRIEIGMINVATNTLMWSDSLDAPGTAFQLAASGVKLDDSGEFLSGSSWGDSLNLTPECFAYDETGSQTAAIDLAGSAFSIALSPDGEVAAAGSKGVHANTFGNGGALTAFDPFDQIFHINGNPFSGMPIDLVFDNTPITATMGFSSGLAPSLTALGVFDIDLSSLLSSVVFGVPASGIVTMTVPPTPGLIGQAVHVQGYTSDGAGNLQMTVKASTRVLL